MTIIPYVAAALIILCIAVLFFAWRLKQQRRLPPVVRRKLRSQWARLASVQDDQRRVLDAEKIVDHALSTLGYTGTFADKLRAAGPRFRDVQSVWNAHKLRNRIAHEMEAAVNPREVVAAINAFERAFGDLE